MSDPRVAKWKQTGKIFLWKYKGNPKNYRGWHLTADKAGAKNLLELLTLILVSGYSEKIKIVLTKPSSNELSVPNCPSKPQTYPNWILAHSKQKMETKHWRFLEGEGNIILEAGADGLAQLREGVEKIISKGGDYFVGLTGHELWFWWFLEKESF